MLDPKPIEVDENLSTDFEAHVFSRHRCLVLELQDTKLCSDSGDHQRDIGFVRAYLLVLRAQSLLDSTGTESVQDFWSKR